MEETYKYRKLLADKTSLDENQIMELILELISASNIEIIKESELRKFKDEAEKVSPRKNDAPYFAVALYKNCKIWSNDGPIKRGQDKIDILTTKDIVNLLASL